MTDTAAISETVSKKRGRPEKFSGEWFNAMKSLHPELRSSRQVMAKCYEVEAFGCLVDDHQTIEGIGMIFDRASGVYAATVLEHLGRLHHDDWLERDGVRAAAVWISARRQSDRGFTARKAVDLLRALREELQARAMLGMPAANDAIGKLLALLVDEAFETEGD